MSNQQKRKKKGNWMRRKQREDDEEKKKKQVRLNRKVVDSLTIEELREPINQRMDEYRTEILNIKDSAITDLHAQVFEDKGITVGNAKRGKGLVIVL
jgi:hypothetical protein